ncbi:MAG TPA: ABC transporter permease [Bryobacteraceae bacterium]|nr:ABC transporter permease [Bryobacteraceae bacterium]
MHGLWQDVRYGVRGLGRDRGFTFLAVLALALGIGSVTTIYSVIENVLLDPFPYRDARHIISFYIHDLDQGERGGRGGFQIPEFLDYKEQNRIFDGVIGSGNSDVLYTNGEGTDRFQGAYVTPDAFDVLGARALLGRGITPADGQPGAPPVFVMAYKLWAKNFNYDRGILGRTFVLNQKPRTLVGIMPPRFTWWGADLWTPDPLDRNDPDVKIRNFAFLGHLKPGIDERRAAADLNVLAHQLAKKYPDQYPKRFNVQTQTLAEGVVGQFRPILFTLLAAVCMLLLIACGNVANMLLARATAREKEIAIRTSLGAGRWQILRQLMVESLLLALAAAVAGCGLAWGGLKVLVAAIPQQTIPDEAVISLNLPVLAFALAVTIVTALLFGLAPALLATGRQLAEPLKDSGKGVSGGFRRGRLRNALIVAEVGLSMVLLVGAGLLMRTFVALQNVDLGLNPNNVLVVRLPLPREQYKTAAAKQRFFRELLGRLHALPGVVAATETSSLPPYGGIPTDVDVPGRTHSENWQALFQLVSDGYFQTLQIQLLRGRLLSESEVAQARKVAVINQSLARKFFGDEDPVGRMIVLKTLQTWPEPVKDPVFEVVGITADAKNRGVQDPPMPEAFIPYTVTGFAERGILVRTAQDPMTLLPEVQRQVWATDRNVALTLTGSMRDYLKRFTYAQPRFALILLALFSGVGLVLVAIGVYSVIAYTVSRQTHEIGIRVALGASQANVLMVVLRMGLVLVGLGVAAGLAASFAATRLISSQLWGVKPYDPLTLAAVITVVLVAGIAACLIPARRATRVDPMQALRYE